MTEPITSATLLEKLRYAPPDEEAWSAFVHTAYLNICQWLQQEMAECLPPRFRVEQPLRADLGQLPELLPSVLAKIQDCHRTPALWHKRGLLPTVVQHLVEQLITPPNGLAERLSPLLASLQARLDGDDALAQRLRPRFNQEAELAWKRFFQMYDDLIRCWVRRRTQPSRPLSDADLDEIASDISLNLLRALPGFHYEPEKGSFRGYLSTVIANTVRDWSRRKRQQLDPGGADQAEVLAALPDPHELARELDEKINEAVQHLREAMQIVQQEVSPEDWTAFTRIKLDRRSTAEVSAEQDRGVGAIATAVWRVKKKLQAECEKRPGRDVLLQLVGG